MNRLCDALIDVCDRHVLAEKWLVAPSRRVGQQWLERVARGGTPVINVHVKTLASLAIDVAADQMADRRVTLASPRGCIFLIERIVRHLRQEPFKYLQELAPSVALAETIYRSISSIRMAGLNEEQLTLRCFEVEAKGRDLKAILRAYQSALHESHYIDAAELFRMAASQVRERKAVLPADLRLLIPANIEFTEVERQLLDAFPADQRTTLPIDELLADDPAGDGQSVKTDLDLLRRMLHPGDAPPPVGDGSVAIRHAIGEVNEVREVLRRCVSGQLQFDEVELLHTDAETYVPLVYETLCVTARDGESLGDGLPVTFAEGVPCSYSRPGRALRLWVTWVTDGYPQATIVQMLREGLLELPQADDSNASFGRLAGLLRALGIGFGRKRYASLLGAEIAGLERQIAAGDTERDEDGEPRSGRTEARQRDLREYRLLAAFCESLLACSPADTTDHAAMLTGAATFLKSHVRSISQLDRFAVPRLTADIEEMAKWLAEDTQADFEASDWLTKLPAEAHILGSGPRPGCLHVAHVISGGHSGRPNVFIVGLDDSRFPGTGMQDPLLLDGERRKLSADLPTAASRLASKLNNFSRLLARLRGRVTLSYCAQAINDDREMFPSNLILSAFRLVSGLRAGDQGDLQKWLATQGPPACFAPARAEESLSAAEWWKWRLCGAEAVHDAELLVLDHYPHLARGLHAINQRQSDEFTEYDGRVEVAGPDLDPQQSDERVFSANRLQTIGRCPLKFFFDYGLGVKPPPDLTVDPNVWLDALAAGALLHEVFEQFMRELVDSQQLPDHKRDATRLRMILTERVAHYRDLAPSPSEGVFKRQFAELEQAVMTFLKEEDHYCRQQQCRPVYLEASLGMPPYEHGTPLDTPEPVIVTLPGGRPVRLRGRIDRIDLVGDGAIKTYRVWDYKTGSTYGYDRAHPFRGGRVLQPFLYVTMVEHRLREVIDPQAEVSHFGFFFPGKKARGERIEWGQQELAEGRQTLARLVQIVANGAFLPTNNADDCRFCDYLGVCGDAEATAASSAKKLDAPGNEVLVAMRSLRND